MKLLAAGSFASMALLIYRLRKPVYTPTHYKYSAYTFAIKAFGYSSLIVALGAVCVVSTAAIVTNTNSLPELNHYIKSRLNFPISVTDDSADFAEIYAELAKESVAPDSFITDTIKRKLGFDPKLE